MLQKFENKNIAVYGLGKTGQGILNFLLHLNDHIFAWDDDASIREKIKLSVLGQKVTLTSPEFYLWDEIDYLIPSPGIDLKNGKGAEVVEMARKNNCEIVSDIEVLTSVFNKSFSIAVTGSNGKSTTTALIYHILKHLGVRTKIGGNIGIPAGDVALDLLREYQNNLNDKSNILILETSSYQLEALNETKFNVSILLNIIKDHIERHGSYEKYIEAKKKIFNNQKEGDFAIISVDDDLTKKIYKDLSEKQTITMIPISTEEIIEGGVCIKHGIIYDYLDKNVRREFNLGLVDNLPGKHNLQNIAASYASVMLLLQNKDLKEKYLPNDDYYVLEQKIVKHINSFEGLRHRNEKVGECGNISFVNDSKGTNHHATEQSLACFKNIIWLCGGLQKEDGITPLKDKSSNVIKCFLFGSSEDDFFDEINSWQKNLSVEKTHTLDKAFEAAVVAAYDFVRQGVKPTILLSPACSSFDQFKNFESRGDYFCKLVKDFCEFKFLI